MRHWKQLTSDEKEEILHIVEEMTGEGKLWKEIHLKTQLNRYHLNRVIREDRERREAYKDGCPLDPHEELGRRHGISPRTANQLFDAEIKTVLQLVLARDKLDSITRRIGGKKLGKKSLQEAKDFICRMGDQALIIEIMVS